MPSYIRLLNTKDFLTVSKKGHFFSVGCLSLKMSPSGLSVSRIGISIGKKFSKKAVDRNRAKRLIREVIRAHANSIKPGYDIVIFATKKLPSELLQIDNKLTLLLKKSHLSH